jgi:hypothetical protein
MRVIKSRIGWAGLVAQMGRTEACTGFWWRNLREGYLWGDPGIDGRITFRSSGSGIWRYGLFGLAQDRDRWQALLNVVMNLQVS